MGGGEAERSSSFRGRGRRRERRSRTMSGEGNDGVGAAVGGEVEGDGRRGKGTCEIGVVGPGRESRPVVNGVGDDAGLVWRDKVSEELKWGWWRF